mmetsp:Transcript_50545/g.114800  ORF Transcript_50545/g.114800 Transcript_50545/m.114800 type:complete len:233 (+) Transcript_50545:595-1293(+)
MGEPTARPWSDGGGEDPGLGRQEAKGARGRPAPAGSKTRAKLFRRRGGGGLGGRARGGARGEGGEWRSRRRWRKAGVGKGRGSARLAYAAAAQVRCDELFRRLRAHLPLLPRHRAAGRGSRGEEGGGQGRESSRAPRRDQGGCREYGRGRDRGRDRGQSQGQGRSREEEEEEGHGATADGSAATAAAAAQESRGKGGAWQILPRRFGYRMESGWWHGGYRMESRLCLESLRS